MLKIEPEFLKAVGSDRYLLGCKQMDGSSSSYTFTMLNRDVDGDAFRSLQHEDAYYFAVSEDPSRDWLDEAIHYFDSERVKVIAANTPEEKTPQSIVCSAPSMDGHFEYRIVFGSSNLDSESGNGSDSRKDSKTDADAKSNYTIVTITDSGISRLARSEIGTCEANLEGGWWKFKDAEGSSSDSDSSSGSGSDLLKAILRFHEARFYSAEQVSSSFDLSRKQ